MKKNFTTLLMAATVASSFAALPVNNQVIFSGDKMPSYRQGEAYSHVILTKRPGTTQTTTVSRADESTYTVTLHYDYDNTKYYCQTALLCDATNSYIGMVGKDPNVILDGVKPGEYYLMTQFSNVNVPNCPTFNLVYKLVTVDGDVTVNVSPDEANRRLTFTQFLPDGKLPVLPTVPEKDSDEYDWTGATAHNIAAYTTLWSEKSCYSMTYATNQLDTSLDGIESDVLLDLNITELGDDWHIAQTRWIEDLDENRYYAHIGVSGTVTQPEVPTPDYAEWKYDFATDNPAVSLIGGAGYEYGVIPIPFIDNEINPGMWEFGVDAKPRIFLSEPKGVNSGGATSNYGVQLNRVEVNQSKETSMGYKLDIRGVVSPVVSWDNDTQEPVFIELGAGIYGSAIWWNKNSENPGMPGNTIFACGANGLTTKLGQSAPVMLMVPIIYKGTRYDNIIAEPFYIGLYGEDRGADGALSTAYLRVEGDDEIVCDYDDLRKTMENLSEEGKFTKPFSIEIVNDRNILIDDIAGYNVSVMDYPDPSNAAKAYGPTATMLQFRNSAGVITNRFAEPGDGYILLSGGDFTLVEGNYWDCHPVTLKVEYATRAGEEWTEIAMTEEPENFLMPSFGNFWRGSLADVEGLTRDGWYKLRISMTDADGNSQVQTIYPAFCVEKFAGVESVGAADNADAPVEYFNMQGQRVVNPAAGQILVRRQGNNVSKTVVR